MKKNSANWNIAATHYLTAGFVIPFIVSLATGFVLSAVGMDIESLQAQLISEVLWYIATWLGVMYSAGYLAKKYVIIDAKKIVRLSTLYRVVVPYVFIGGSILLLLNIEPDTVIDTTQLTISGVSTLIGAVVFYIASQKYIKQDSVEPSKFRPSGM